MSYLVLMGKSTYAGHAFQARFEIGKGCVAVPAYKGSHSEAKGACNPTDKSCVHMSVGEGDQS
eukprot:1148640-Pelagomonas_calceolata.AAC.2